MQEGGASPPDSGAFLLFFFLPLHHCQRPLSQSVYTPRACSPSVSTQPHSRQRLVCGSPPKRDITPNLYLSCQQAKSWCPECLWSTCAAEACSLVAQQLWTGSGSDNPENVISSGAADTACPASSTPVLGRQPPLKLSLPWMLFPNPQVLFRVFFSPS